MGNSVLDPRTVPKRLSPVSRALLSLLGSSAPQVGPAGPAAKRLGLCSRFGLARQLKRDGIPPLHRLRGWFDVLRWVRVGEQDAVSLCRVAFVSHRDPAACYRLVKRVTGHAWSEVRTLGSDWVTARISELLHEGDAPQAN